MALEKWKAALVFVSVTILGICLAVVIYFYQVFYSSDRFLPGVQIADVPVAGLTIDQAAAKLTGTLDTASTAPLEFYRETYTYKTNMQQLAIPLDINQIVKQVWQKERKRALGSKIVNLDGAHIISYPQKIVYRQGPMGELLQTFNSKLGIPMVDARLDVDLEKGLVIVPGSYGLAVDVNDLMANLPREWGDFQNVRIPISMINQKPRVNEEDLRDMGELSSFSTWFNTSEVNRSSNLRKAAQTLNGTMVQPGETVSFNKTIGPRTAETGFNEALVIVGGKFVPGVGGGICQVSTTLYNACLLAGLNIVERHQHNMAVSYVPLGRDATVSYGQQDFRFQNNTDSPIYIRAVTSGGTITVNIYGDLAHKQKIALSSTVDAVSPFKEVHLIDNTLAPGQVKVEHAGINGYSVRAFRSFYDSDGKLIKQELLSNNHYLTLDKIIHSGPGSNLSTGSDGSSGSQTVTDDGDNQADPNGSSPDSEAPAPEAIDDASAPAL